MSLCGITHVEMGTFLLECDNAAADGRALAEMIGGAEARTAVAIAVVEDDGEDAYNPARRSVTSAAGCDFSHFAWITTQLSLLVECSLSRLELRRAQIWPPEATVACPAGPNRRRP